MPYIRKKSLNFRAFIQTKRRDMSTPESGFGNPLFWIFSCHTDLMPYKEAWCHIRRFHPKFLQIDLNFGRKKMRILKREERISHIYAKDEKFIGVINFYRNHEMGVRSMNTSRTRFRR